MGSFNLYTYISNRVLPQNNSSDNSKENYTFVHRRSVSSSVILPKETIQQLYPCEDRHSFNPHYQHNLHSASPYSTPPSLSSSPTNSSPSSTSSSSSHSLSHSGHKPYYQYNHPSARRSASSQSVQQQYHQQYQKHNRSNSYTRQQTKRQNHQQRNNVNQYFDALDDDLVIGYDGQRFFYESGASSMVRVHPNGSPSYSSYPSSVSSTFGGRHPSQQQQQQRWSSHISWSENENIPSPASRSHSAAQPSTPESNHIQNRQNSITSSLPRISEVAVTESNIETHSTCNTTSDSRTTARHSLMRIVQCDIRNDDWCSQQSGQWTRHYAETRSIGVKADGRRTGRL
ncbi:hypothetical protein BGZ49_007560 [Haplosporangium sp. Z 27]|nr:hypothetical protein BGZ49_007560 [Haplosporangium sp. Z 27]